jgi:hypothetical protein
MVTVRAQVTDDITGNSSDADPQGVTEDIGPQGKIFEDDLAIHFRMHHKFVHIDLGVEVLAQLAVIRRIAMQGMQPVGQILDAIEDIAQPEIRFLFTLVLLPKPIQIDPGLANAGRQRGIFHRSLAAHDGDADIVQFRREIEDQPPALHQ